VSSIALEENTLLLHPTKSMMNISTLAQTLDIVQTAINLNFTILVQALTAADLVNSLKTRGPFTVFAPTDAAFAKLPADLIATMIKPENKEMLRKILGYHVLSGKYTSAAINTVTLPATLTMLAGGTVTVRLDGSTIKVNKASVTFPDIFAANGIIHAIDTVLVPPLDIIETAITTGNFKTLISALQVADMDKTLKGSDPFTVFAPTDAAFAKLPADLIATMIKPENKEMLRKILGYHVLSGKYTSAAINTVTLPATLTMLAGGTVTVRLDGSTIKVNNASVTFPDIFAANGIIHGIDSVLIPPESRSCGFMISFNQGLFMSSVLVVLLHNF
jgi:transforming growth factor-beta-induced protein